MKKVVNTTIEIETNDEVIANKILALINDNLFDSEKKNFILTYKTTQQFVEEKLDDRDDRVERVKELLRG